ncbi:right-handed parallel beta-helix repeat-containing protein, partial [Chloroflexota bacterium]
MRNSISGCEASAIVVEEGDDGEDSTGNNVESNRVTDSELGIELISVTDNTVVGNNISDCRGSGIYLDNAPYNVIEGNKVSTSGVNGISFVDSGYVEIISNQVSNCGGKGVWGARVNDSHIMNNEVYRCEDGIILRNATADVIPSNQIIGNHVMHSGDTGIGLTGDSSDNLVEGNHVGDSGVV